MDFAVRFSNVYKEYPFYQHMTAGLKSFLFHLPKNISSLRQSRFIALNDVSFEIQRGETFGIVGKNGSGKSTILGLIAGVIQQDRGKVETRGKISSLLELGAGFHPDLSGIENIVLNGILMGNTREEMEKRLDAIVGFSELGDFIYQPLRTYSSGMYVRLGFSVAVHIEPEILLVDEALAVGDMGFQEKCIKRMAEFRKSGATIIIVSHDTESLELMCDRVAWVDHGSLMELGKPRKVVKSYRDYIGRSEISSEEKDAEVSGQSVSVDEAVVQTGPKETVNAVSWWDVPAVVKECEDIITGDPALFFYDFLRTTYFPEPMERGLSICNRPRGIENNFISYNVCQAFDVIDDDREIAAVLEGAWSFGQEAYDLFLCVDLLNRVKDLGLFLPHLHQSLRDRGTVVAFEYVGPTEHRWSPNDRTVAENVFGILTALLQVHMPMPSLEGTGGELPVSPSSQEVIPRLNTFFDVVSVRHFGGPFFDLLLDGILKNAESGDKRYAHLISPLIRLEHILTGAGILRHAYAMIIARKATRG